MFALSNRSFRNAGLAFYGLGSLASLGLISDQASAQTVASNDKAAYLAAKCDHLYSKPPEHAGCYAQEALNFERARGAAAQSENDKLLSLKDCIEFLRENRGKSFTQERMMELAGGKVSESNACSVARHLGFIGRRAGL